MYHRGVSVYQFSSLYPGRKWGSSMLRGKHLCLRRNNISADICRGPGVTEDKTLQQSTESCFRSRSLHLRGSVLLTWPDCRRPWFSCIWLCAVSTHTLYMTHHTWPQVHIKLMKDHFELLSCGASCLPTLLRSLLVQYLFKVCIILWIFYCILP